MKKLFLVLTLMTIKLHAAEMTVHYSRLGGYENWNLWVWNEEEKTPGFAVPPSGTDAFGAVFRLDPEKARVAGKRVGLLPRKGEWEDKDAPDRFVTAANGEHIYLLEGDGQVYAQPPEVSTKVTGAWLDGEGLARAAFNRPVDEAYVKSRGFYLSKGDLSYHPVGFAPAGEGPYARAWRLRFDSLGKPDYPGVNAGAWKLHGAGLEPVALELGEAVYAEDFYSAAPLGAVEEEGGTVIRVFAPKATAVTALVCDRPGDKPREAALEPRGKGIWEKAFGRKLDGKYYRLRTLQGGKTYEGLDPYARCVTRDDGLALIGRESTPVTDGPKFPLSETVLYEAHLRDLTSDEYSGAKHKGKYPGAAEAGTRHPGFPELATGLDHIAELGVNAVHILPLQDFENGDGPDYNWGYMPVNFNSPEGSYATRADDWTRVAEVKKLVDAFHKKGLKVILDVVYNHTAETKDRFYNFNALAKDYYYRVKPDGSYWNGSGCGNEFNTEAPMARRFLLDSLVYWVREYKVDGFRFDLMGLIDTGAAEEIVKALKAVKPDILVYGEPWAAGATPTTGVRKGSQRGKGYSVFGDNFRDALKGSVFNASEPGYVQAGLNREAVKRGIRGSVEDFTDGPLEALNYVSCHDNHTLWDRIDISAKDASYDEKVRMDKLANAVVLTSQGLPFLHAGEEFLRTKKGEHNSYNLPDSVNKLDWTRKKENLPVFNYYRDLIALRKAHPAFRMAAAADARSNLKFYEELELPVEEPAVAYVLYGDRAGDAWGRIAVLVNPGRKPLKFKLPEGDWQPAFDENGLYRGPARTVAGECEVPAISLAVLKR